MRHFVVLDVSLTEVAIRVVDENGIIIPEGAVVSEPREIADWIGATGVEVARIGLEIEDFRAGCMASCVGWDCR